MLLENAALAAGGCLGFPKRLGAILSDWFNLAAGLDAPESQWKIVDLLPVSQAICYHIVPDDLRSIRRNYLLTQHIRCHNGELIIRFGESSGQVPRRPQDGAWDPLRP